MKKKHLRKLAYAGLVLLTLGIGSCGSGKKGGERAAMFRYNQASGITSMDPAFARDQANIWTVNQLFDGLVQLDRELNIQPALAKSWDISEDGLTYTFHLRTDVYFHEHEAFGGQKRKLTAADVAYSLDRIIDTKVASPGAWIFNDRVAADDPFTAIDDSTFQLKLLRPFRPMLSILSLQYCFIVPKEVVDMYGRDFRIHPVGTGPFMLKTYRDSEILLMEKNPDYYQTENGRQLPYIDGVKVTFIENRQTEFLHFMRGELDFISGVDASYINDLLSKDGELLSQHRKKMQLYKAPYLNTEYLGFLMDQSKLKEPVKPLQNVLIRKAINYGFNRAEMMRYLRNNVGKAATAGFVPYGLPSFDPEQVIGYTYQPDSSRVLLAKAGFPEGKGLPDITLYTNNNYKDLGTYIQKQLGEVGIKLKLETVPAAFQRELMARSEAPFFRGSWIADYPDAESYLAMFYSKHDAPPNYTRFSNARFDELYEAALNENDDARRYEMYREMDRIILNEAAVVPLYYDEVLRFVSKGIGGMEPNAMNLLDLRKVCFE